MARSEDQAAVRRLAVDAVTKVLDGIDFFDEPAAIRNSLIGVLPALINAYGDIAATLAAEYFEDVIGERATLADPVSDDEVAQGVVWALGPLFRKKQDIPAAINQIVELVDSTALGQGDRTTQASVAATGRQWRWVTYGDTCDYCLAKAARGPVFSDDNLVGRKRHSKCNCIPEPV